MLFGLSRADELEGWIKEVDELRAEFQNTVMSDIDGLREDAKAMEQNIVDAERRLWEYIKQTDREISYVETDLKQELATVRDDLDQLIVRDDLDQLIVRDDLDQLTHVFNSGLSMTTDLLRGEWKASERELRQEIASAKDELRGELDRRLADLETAAAAQRSRSQQQCKEWDEREEGLVWRFCRKDAEIVELWNKALKQDAKSSHLRLQCQKWKERSADLQRESDRQSAELEQRFVALQACISEKENSISMLRRDLEDSSKEMDARILDLQWELEVASADLHAANFEVGSLRLQLKTHSQVLADCRQELFEKNRALQMERLAAENAELRASLARTEGNGEVAVTAENAVQASTQTSGPGSLSSWYQDDGSDSFDLDYNFVPGEPTAFVRDKELPQRCLVLTFNKNPKQLSEALAPLANVRGVELEPAWAKGAKVLVRGLTKELMRRSSFPPERLRPCHVLASEADEEAVMGALEPLKCRVRPRLKERAELQVEVRRTFVDIPLPKQVSPRSSYTVTSSDRQGIANPRKWPARH